MVPSFARCSIITHIRLERRLWLALRPNSRLPLLCSRRATPTNCLIRPSTLLIHISSSLRWITLASPELWKDIHIPIVDEVSPNISDLAHSAVDKQADGVKAWLRRRLGNLPFRISVWRTSQEELMDVWCSRPSHRLFWQWPNGLAEKKKL